MEDLRLELRTRNNRLWHLIFDAGETVASFCRTHDYCQQRVGAFLNLTRSPYSSRGISPTAQRIADTAGMLVEDLFPRDLYADRIPRRLVAEIPSRSYRGLTAAKRIALPPMQDDVVLQRELRASMDAAMETLTSRERRIIRARFGLDDQGDGASLSGLGIQEGVGPERIRQIEAKALRKLRHASRIKYLRPFVHIKPDPPADELPIIDAVTGEAVPASASTPVYFSQDATAALLQEGVRLMQSMTKR